MKERRRRRSDRPHEALSLYLSRLAEEGALGAALVSDGDGLLVGGAARDAAVDLEALAATRHGPGVRSQALHYQGETLYLVTQGRAPVGVDGARDAVGRILSLSVSRDAA